MAQESSMSSAAKRLNFVLFDLSTLDSPSAASYLAELAHRESTGSLTYGEVCHWIVSPVRSLDLLSATGTGPDFLRARLRTGDRLFCSHPSGLDWQGLFPMEAEQELRALTALITHETHLFLQDSGVTPPWMSSVSRTVFRPTETMLVVHAGAEPFTLPWGGRGAGRSSRGVWWIAPGQALVSGLPALPWGDLTKVTAQRLRRFRKLRPNQTGPYIFSPLQKLPLSATAQLRRSSTPTPLHQAILYHSQEYPGLGTKEAVDFDEALGGIRKRALVANMQGVTDFQEAGLKVRFQNGRLIRMEDSLHKQTLCYGAESSITWNGRKHRFETNSAFSFEGDFSWGLRQSLVLKHDDLAEPGRIILDYFFVEESREFFVAATVRWPRWKAPAIVQHWSVLELDLVGPSSADSLVTRTLWPDGSSRDALHRRRPRQGVLCGTDFVFGLGKAGLVLGFPQNQAPRPHYLPWRLERRLTGWRLLLNPEGGQGARPSAEFDGIEEHFSFYLNRAEGAKLPFTVTRKQATELIPPYILES